MAENVLSASQILAKTFTGNATRVVYSADQAIRASFNPAGPSLRVTADNSPTWVKVSFTHTQFQAAALVKTIDLYTLLAGWMIHDVKIKHSASFTGGTIASYTIQCGITGTLGKYLAAFNVFQAPGAAVVGFGGVKGMESQDADTILKVTATSTVGNLNASTAGAVDIWLQISKAV